MPDRRPADSPAAIRLTFLHEGGGLGFKRATRVAMRAPAGDGPRRTDRTERSDQEERDDRIGNWVEIRDANDSLLYRRRIDRPVPEAVEVHEGGEEGTFRRVERGEASSLVNVLVPDIDGARTVVLRERRPPTGDREEIEEIEYAKISLDRIDEIDDTDPSDQDDDGDDHGDGDDADEFDEDDDLRGSSGER
jgi:hypothetical protein